MNGLCKEKTPIWEGCKDVLAKSEENDWSLVRGFEVDQDGKMLF